MTTLRQRHSTQGQYATLGKLNSLEQSAAEDFKHYNRPRPKYNDMRVTSEGKEIQADMAINALGNFYHRALPIFEYESEIILEEDLPNHLSYSKYIYTDEDGNKSTSENIHGVKPTLNRLISDQAKETDEKNRPIVFALTSVKHAILCILSEDGNLYTVGFGYSGTDQQTKLLNTLRMNENYGEDIAHHIEVINGALYTADYLLPENTMACKISWIGYLDEPICERLEEYLQQTQTIVYSLKKTGRDKYFVRNECTLIVNQKYSESSGVINRGATNCIRWVQQILGVQLNCGLVSIPGQCMGIEDDEWEEIANGLEDRNVNTVYDTIKKIQHRLKPNVCKQGWQSIGGICKFMGLTRGGRRTRKIGKNRKNKRKNKSRVYKKSRTYKRK